METYSVNSIEGGVLIPPAASAAVQICKPERAGEGQPFLVPAGTLSKSGKHHEKGAYLFTGGSGVFSLRLFWPGAYWK